MPSYKLPDLRGFPDCSGLSENGRCVRLNVTKCQGKECLFKRTHEEENDSIKRAYQRLLSLDRSNQIYIAQKYFGGTMPWEPCDEKIPVESIEKTNMKF